MLTAAGGWRPARLVATPCLAARRAPARVALVDARRRSPRTSVADSDTLTWHAARASPSGFQDSVRRSASTFSGRVVDETGCASSGLVPQPRAACPRRSTRRRPSRSVADGSVETVGRDLAVDVPTKTGVVIAAPGGGTARRPGGSSAITATQSPRRQARDPDHSLATALARDVEPLVAHAQPTARNRAATRWCCAAFAAGRARGADPGRASDTANGAPRRLPRPGASRSARTMRTRGWHKHALFRCRAARDLRRARERRVPRPQVVKVDSRCAQLAAGQWRILDLVDLRARPVGRSSKVASASGRLPLPIYRGVVRLC